MIPEEALEMNKLFDNVMNQKKVIERIRFRFTRKSGSFVIGGNGQDTKELLAIAFSLTREKRQLLDVILQYHTGATAVLHCS